MAGGGTNVMEQRIAVKIAELYTIGHDGIESALHHGMLVYKCESLDTHEEPLLGLIIAKRDRQQKGESMWYITTTLDHSLGRRMIDVGQATDAGDRV